MDPIKHTSKLWERKTDQGSNFLFWCPACKCGHSFPTPRWGFDGRADCPTFAPSLRLFYVDPETKQQHTVCHLNITRGQIIYHGDCPHELKGQVLPMADLPVDYGY